MEAITCHRLLCTSAGESFQPRGGQLGVWTPGSRASLPHPQPLIFCGPPASFKGYTCRLCTSHKGNMKVKGEDRLITVLYPAASLADSLKVLSGVMKRPAPHAACRPRCLGRWPSSCHSSGSYSNLTGPPQPSLHWCLVSSPWPPPFFSLKAPLTLHHPSPNQSHLRNKALCPPPCVSCSPSVLRAIHPHIF